MFCEQCGKPVSDYAKYCRHCGAKLEYYKLARERLEQERQKQQKTAQSAELGVTHTIFSFAFTWKFLPVPVRHAARSRMEEVPRPDGQGTCRWELGSEKLQFAGGYIVAYAIITNCTNI